MKRIKHDIIIVGAGLSGLSTAHFLVKNNPSTDLCLLEKRYRAGGAIQSEREQGVLAEWGAHGFLDNVAESRELMEDLDAGNKIQKAPLKQFVRYFCRNGELVRIPQTPTKIIKSNILPLWAKLRFVGDLWKKPRTEELTIAQWASYRFGKSIIPFADMAITGTCAGDISKLSIEAAMPGLRRLEKEYGSVLRGALKTRKNKADRAMPSMVSFKGGMQELVTLLETGKNIHLNTCVTDVKKQDNRWVLGTEKAIFEARHVVVATHINQALPLLSKLQTPPQPSVNEAFVLNVIMGFDQSAKIPYGFGYLAPASENRFALGALFSMHMFEARAPKNINIIEVLVGGTRNPENLELEDDELVERAYQDIRQLIDLPNPPVFAKVLRPVVGIPQLEKGHLNLIDYHRSIQKSHDNLHVCGFGWKGVGINDMIKMAKQAAHKICEKKSQMEQGANAKGIYF